MRKCAVIVLAIFAGILSLSCVGQPAGTETALGQAFTLSPGQTASIQGEQLQMKFVEVVSDSRCPTGATCVWQGEASCLLQITHSGSKQGKVLTQPGLTEGPSKTFFENYEIQFNVLPYPKVGTSIDKKDYRLDLVIARNP